MYDDEWRFWLTVTGVVVLGIALLLGCCVAAGNYFNYPGQVAEIEAVRAAVVSIDRDKSEDVYGQAVELNRLIHNMRAYNGIWWVAWAVPNGWDDIEPIDTDK